MGNSGMVDRRSILKAAAAFGGLSTLAAVAPTIPAVAQESEIPAAASAGAKLKDVLAGANTKLTIERRGQIVLFGINRPHIQNRIDPETFEKLAEAYYQYDHDPSLRAAILFGHGENFSRGIDVEGFKSLVGCDAINIGGSRALKILRTPLKAPTANAYCERLIGTVRRECLDYVIPIDERHLRRILSDGVAHYNRGRPHSSLGPGLPDRASVSPPRRTDRHHLAPTNG